MTNLEKALADIGNQVYAETKHLENPEDQRGGNGHHLRQAIALRAQINLYLSWPDQEEKDILSATHPVKEALQRESQD